MKQGRGTAGGISDGRIPGGVLTSTAARQRGQQGQYAGAPLRPNDTASTSHAPGHGRWGASSPVPEMSFSTACQAGCPQHALKGVSEAALYAEFILFLTGTPRVSWVRGGAGEPWTCLPLLSLLLSLNALDVFIFMLPRPHSHESKLLTHAASRNVVN